MNIVQTLYTSKGKNPLTYNYGWAAPEYHLMSWALSCLQLKKFHQKVSLYTDSTSASILIDALALPYDEVYISHDNLQLPDESLWAIPKIYTYSIQKAPFLHVDGDVFIFDSFKKDLLSSELIVQNIERATEVYLTTQNDLEKCFNYFPPCVKQDFESKIPIRAVNAGILGGNNIKFIGEYAKEAFKYIERNKGNLGQLVNAGNFNVFFEQHLFYVLAKQENIEISILMSEVIGDHNYTNLANFHNVPFESNYLHLLGHAKRDGYTCLQMAKTLRALHPEFYYRIVCLYREHGLPFFMNYDFDNSLSTVEDFVLMNAMVKKESTNSSLPEINASTIKSSINYSSFFSEIVRPEFSNCTADMRVLMANDLEVFLNAINDFLIYYSRINKKYLYAISLESNNWYSYLFADCSKLKDKLIVRCHEVKIIHSVFDWSGIYNKRTRIGVPHYKNLQINKGSFANLLIPEIYNNPISFYDLDELECIILEHLVKPQSLDNLIRVMHQYLDEDVLKNNLQEYESLIITFIRQLVLQKAVKPIL
ncbi:DUF6734 family protein [Hymenobacter cheonanensis]|uniref:DUF6734 family protein n=1 Tax=Hymenobacter sp. CA2-7 TaxID=3063993 RepID=UPI0027125AC6|nr:DUF6734 family protein [Hymenobacter sp. CA2-7]MDO7884249.1 hypothetical protein [Hymenobacter sp. CA2-7]